MSCASCDDCPADKWHLHVTVVRAFDQTSTRAFDQTSVEPTEYLYARHCAQIGACPVLVTNLLLKEKWLEDEAYVERIPTIHFSGTLAKAQHEIVLLACNLTRLGWFSTRAKIEGSPSLASRHEHPFCYWEAHVSVPRTPESLRILRGVRIEGWRPPLSTSDGRLIVTVRAPRRAEVDVKVDRLEHELFGRVVVLKKRTEVCVMDTAPELDDRWLGK